MYLITHRFVFRNCGWIRDLFLLKNGSSTDPQELLIAFQAYYCHFEHLVTEATTHATDSTVLSWLGEKLDEYINLIIMVSLQA